MADEDSQYLALKSFVGDQIKNVRQHYDWEVPPNNFNIALEGINSFEKNLSLKRGLNDLLLQTPARKSEVVSWYIKEWGGIRGIKAHTIAEYVNLDIPHFNTESPSRISFYGISSYSKVLSILDLTEFAIYDARVAFAINAIDILYNGARGYLFLSPDSRSNDVLYLDVTAINKFYKIRNQPYTDAFLIKKTIDKDCLAPDFTYWHYWKLLKSLTQELNLQYPSEAEMVLFASTKMLHYQLIEFIKSNTTLS